MKKFTTYEYIYVKSIKLIIYYILDFNEKVFVLAKFGEHRCGVCNLRQDIFINY